MAFCNNCGKELLAADKFCAGCGKMIGMQEESKTDSRQTLYDGDLHKCPECGEPLNAFVTRCPVCNYELRGTQKTSCVHELSVRIETTETQEQKAELISNFYIPNTKEDIYEFFILAYSNITAGEYAIDAWAVKLEQAYLKAKLAFGNSEEFNCIKELYENLNKTPKKRNEEKIKSRRALLLMLSGALVASACLVAEEILNEFDIYMWPALNPMSIMGFVCFGVGLVLLVFSQVKIKKRK